MKTFVKLYEDYFLTHAHYSPGSDFAKWLDRLYYPSTLAVPEQNAISAALNVIGFWCDGNKETEVAFEYIRKLVRQHFPSSASAALSGDAQPGEIAATDSAPTIPVADNGGDVPLRIRIRSLSDQSTLFDGTPAELQQLANTQTLHVTNSLSGLAKLFPESIFPACTCCQDIDIGIYIGSRRHSS